MFESVLERNLPPRQIGRAASVAIGVHAVVVVAAVYLSARPAPVIEKEIRALTVFTQPARLAQAGPAAAGANAQAARPRTEHRAVRQVPVNVDKTKKRTEESSSGAAPLGDSSHASADPGPAADGPGRAPSSGEASGTAVPAGTTIAIPFGGGMMRPTPIAQPAPLYTREASAARAEGTVSVRCVITVEGTLKDCRIARSVPFMDAAVLEALSRWKYTPVTFQGRPVSVYYPINLRLVAP